MDAKALYRMVTQIYCEPQRLSVRYLKDSFIFIIVVLKELYNILRSDPDSCEGN